jgi:hypothetical protein
LGKELRRERSIQTVIIQNHRHYFTTLKFANIWKSGACDSLPLLILIIARVGLGENERPFRTIDCFILPFPIFSFCGVEEELESFNLRKWRGHQKTAHLSVCPFKILCCAADAIRKLENT